MSHSVHRAYTARAYARFSEVWGVGWVFNPRVWCGLRSGTRGFQIRQPVSISLIMICDICPMSNYIRPRQPGARVFLTITLAERGSSILVDRIDALRGAVRAVRQAHPFHIDAWVVLPDHMHCVWTLPSDDDAYAARVQSIKARFSRDVPAGRRRPSHVARREKGVWQRRFWEHHIRDDTDYQNHVSYCWHNPVKHGFVEDVRQWPYSSWHRDHT